MFKKILILCNPRTKDAELIKKAIVLSKNEKAALTVFDVVRTLPGGSLSEFESGKLSELQQAAVDQRRRQLASFLRTCGRGANAITPLVLSGDPSVEITKAVVKDRYDLVMLTAEDSGPPRDKGAGVTFLSLIRRCPCPVWVLRPSKHAGYKSILAAVDPTAEGDEGRLNHNIIEYSAFIARIHRAKLNIVHACDFEQEYLI